MGVCWEQKMTVYLVFTHYDMTKISSWPMRPGAYWSSTIFIGGQALAKKTRVSKTIVGGEAFKRIRTQEISLDSSRGQLLMQSKSTKELGETLRACRLRLNLTLKMLGKLTGVSHSHLTRVEHGTRLPSRPVAKKIAENLGLAPEFLIQATEPFRRNRKGEDMEQYTDDIGGIYNVDTPEKFGRILRRGRVLQGLTLREMGERIGVHPSYVWRMEAGDQLPSTALCESIAEVLTMAPKTLAHIAENLKILKDENKTVPIPKSLEATPLERFRALTQELHKCIANKELSPEEVKGLVEDWKLGIEETKKYFTPDGRRNNENKEPTSIRS